MTPERGKNTQALGEYVLKWATEIHADELKLMMHSGMRAGFTHVALLWDGVFVFEGVVGVLGGVVGRRVSIVGGSVKSDRAVTWKGCRRWHE